MKHYKYVCIDIGTAEHQLMQDFSLPEFIVYMQLLANRGYTRFGILGYLRFVFHFSATAIFINRYKVKTASSSLLLPGRSLRSSVIPSILSAY